MTSKECLEKLLEMAIENGLWKSGLVEDLENTIKQDLEVLEIIKKHLTICGLSISCFIGGNPNVKETYEPKFNNLKEWLENE